MGNFKDSSPEKWNSHWNSIPNSVEKLYALISPPFFPFVKYWWEIQAWGQLCFDQAAANATAYNMYNRLPNHGKGFKFHAWKCKMSGPLIGGAKLNGDAPKDFDIFNYVPKH